MSVWLSKNELKALLSKAFEAIYGHQSDYNALADHILWLEISGHKGLDRLMHALPVLTDKAVKTSKVLEQSDSYLSIDAAGHSLIFLSPLISDVMIADYNPEQPLNIDVTNVHPCDGLAMVAALPNIAHQLKGFYGISLRMYQYLALMRSGAKYADIYHIEDDQSFCLKCLKTKADFDILIPIEAKCLISHDQQAQIYKRHILSGIRVSHPIYDKLVKLSENILVPATEASRKGAGE